MANWLFDPGHGGIDSGATYNGRSEKDDVLKLAKRVKEIMESNGEKISLTRTVDRTLSLEGRASIENAGNYDYFVSFHRNAFEPEEAKGIETYSLATTGTGRALAEKVQAELISYFKDRKCKTANFYVLRKTNCPAILIEVGFVDNTEDNKIFDANFENIAKSIARGCLKQVGKTLSDNTPVPEPPVDNTPVYRVLVDGVQEGTAYSVIDNILSFAKEGIEKKASKIEIVKK